MKKIVVMSVLVLILASLVVYLLMMEHSKYELVGKESETKIEASRQIQFGPGGKHQSTYTIKGIEIDGHTIDLVGETSSSEKSFAVNTKKYGPVQIKASESKDGRAFSLALYMTPEQKEEIKALGKE